MKLLLFLVALAIVATTAALANVTEWCDQNVGISTDPDEQVYSGSLITEGIRAKCQLPEFVSIANQTYAGILNFNLKGEYIYTAPERPRQYLVDTIFIDVFCYNNQGVPEPLCRLTFVAQVNVPFTLAPAQQQTTTAAATVATCPVVYHFTATTGTVLSGTLKTAVGQPACSAGAWYEVGRLPNFGRVNLVASGDFSYTAPNMQTWDDFSYTLYCLNTVLCRGTAYILVSDTTTTAPWPAIKQCPPAGDEVWLRATDSAELSIDYRVLQSAGITAQWTLPGGAQLEGISVLMVVGRQLPDGASVVTVKISNAHKVLLQTVRFELRRVAELSGCNAITCTTSRGRVENYCASSTATTITTTTRANPAPTNNNNNNAVIVRYFGYYTNNDSTCSGAPEFTARWPIDKCVQYIAVNKHWYTPADWYVRAISCNGDTGSLQHYTCSSCDASCEMGHEGPQNQTINKCGLHPRGGSYDWQCASDLPTTTTTTAIPATLPPVPPPTPAPTAAPTFAPPAIEHTAAPTSLAPVSSSSSSSSARTITLTTKTLLIIVGAVVCVAAAGVLVGLYLAQRCRNAIDDEGGAADTTVVVAAASGARRTLRQRQRPYVRIDNSAAAAEESDAESLGSQDGAGAGGDGDDAEALPLRQESGVVDAEDTSLVQDH